ncbi:MAG TPA: 3-hydroxyacyl-CoA dehydrogenase family protein [Methylibium sp.]|uniref:3-hydroxyacyl-CoA dehydrogenase family protein n=1 Tax=Methylibium sp. TaxID=2067992 RepID=UPI002DBBF791|nr:3-hydroxyacyl-CoA dehydrogenase family protein [Methylibium sp.]HEU4459660.1 3-hydroxyacyl-CoA dehydrogenase family protein [Methylibium sp.]
MSKPRIAVVGAGLMGHGLAQVFAVAGHRVDVFDTQPAALASLRERIVRNLADLGQDAAAAERVAPVDDLGACVAGADVIFEAGPENLAWKQQLFAQLERLAKPDALLASNTSVIPITRITGGLETGHRAMGTHWWNPPYLVPLVEVIKTPATDAALARSMFDLLAAAGKTPAMVEKDVPGFIGNRLQHALWREAIALVADGVCDAQTVDTVVKASFGRRLPVLGPLENADLVGLELTLAIHETVLPHIDRLPGPSPLLGELIAEGKLGMKSGEGFRRWTPEAQAALRLKLLDHLKAMNAADGGQPCGSAPDGKRSIVPRRTDRSEAGHAGRSDLRGGGPGST